MAKRKSEAISSQARKERALPTPESSVSSPRSPKRAKTTVIDEVNALDEPAFRERYDDFILPKIQSTDGTTTTIELHYAKQLPTSDFDLCLNLIETTSRKDYEASSWGWHPKRKRREMKEPEMRYLLVKNPNNDTFEGFLSFMFTHDSTPPMPVLYVYEIHLTEQTRGRGLGLRLMNLVEELAQKVGADKVMLTCFKSNPNAHAFYKRLGYDTDVCSPGDRRTRNKIVKTDYVIMSKDLRTTADGSATIPDETSEVMDYEQIDASSRDEANEVARLDECAMALRAWTSEHKAEEVLNEGLAAAGAARSALCTHGDAASHRRTLEDLQQFLQTRYEAARDLSEILREQMYHLKCQISDVNRLAEIQTKPNDRAPPLQQGEDGADEFDMEKATEQVYVAYYTLMRKAEEVDNRLDNVADREEEASILEGDLNEREEELDGWEEDLHEREQALAEREARLMRARQRFRRQCGEPDDEPDLGRHIRPLPLMPRDKVDSWLRQNSTEELEDVPLDDIQS